LMLRMPPASVGSEAAGGRLAGRTSGSWTVISEVMARPGAAV
jgi:hypothetical protein